MRSKQYLFRANASTRSFAIVISAYSAFVDIIGCRVIYLNAVIYLWHSFRRCLRVPVRAISGEYPSAIPRSPGPCQVLSQKASKTESFVSVKFSRRQGAEPSGVWPRCVDRWGIRLGQPRCFACGLKLKRAHMPRRQTRRSCQAAGLMSLWS